ncbi:ankyrin repeat domain-containing protein [Micropruina sp.]|uniref:ankyrin repeat domain-containing protein n=1 Tax=Micropruina sp. TaxID=2737536 RepID=UPI0039E62E4C
MRRRGAGSSAGAARGRLRGEFAGAAGVPHQPRGDGARSRDLPAARSLPGRAAGARPAGRRRAARGRRRGAKARRERRARPTLVAETAGLRHWDAVRALVEGGAPIDGALHYAAAAGERAIAEWLVEHGADVDAVDDRFGLTPAGWANYVGHAELAAWLTDRQQ